MSSYRIAVIPGDGIGKEVVPEGLRVLDAAARDSGGTAGTADLGRAIAEALA
ncbi:isocitrate/isopropylmalate family dehydrogenase [Ralstonia pseudosolanacearum]|uniref:isocitrate/isopropylmalate family dehydrogenase n=1 Tax=Ralstonia pseudosolanacearum TaxID=1310165 RepID=UPI0018D0037A|nr:isocitrate/isopropylmalate family dehydrogenase [Ralstonia pseudosolanacearum]